MSDLDNMTMEELKLQCRIERNKVWVLKNQNDKCQEYCKLARHKNYILHNKLCKRNHEIFILKKQLNKVINTNKIDNKQNSIGECGCCIICFKIFKLNNNKINNIIKIKQKGICENCNTNYNIENLIIFLNKNIIDKPKTIIGLKTFKRKTTAYKRKYKIY